MIVGGKILAFMACVAALAAGQCAPARDGQYQLAAKDGLYYSSDFGSTWTPATNSPPTEGGWWSAQVTSGGAVMFAGTLLKSSYVSVTAGASWVPLPGPLLAASGATGQYQVAANRTSTDPYAPAALIVSADAGATWTQALPADTGFYLFATVSHTGRCMSAIAQSNGAVYHSTDYGRSWNQSVIPSGTTKNFVSISISASGQFQLLLSQYNQLLLSKDYGTTFSAVALATQSWAYAAMSCSGEFQVVVAKEGGTVWLSSDYGRTWRVPSGVPSMEQWWWVDMSCSGQYITAAATGSSGGLVVSADYGVTWSTRETGNWEIIGINKVLCD